MEYYRVDPPIDADQLENTVVPFHEAIESLYYYEVHVSPPKWSRSVNQLSYWYEIVRKLRKNDLSHRGYDYPDWREYALLDMARPTRIKLATSYSWYKFIKTIPEAEDLVDLNMDLMEDDLLDILIRIRVGLDNTKVRRQDHLKVYLFGLSYCKLQLTKAGEEVYNNLMPIYNNLYSLLLAKYNLHPIIFKNNSFWRVHSCLFAFPFEVALLDKRTFLDDRSWLVNNMMLLLDGVKK